MLPELYRTFETRTLKDLVSYGDHPVDEEPRPEESIPREDDASPRRRVSGEPRRSRSLASGKARKRGKRGKNGGWARLGGRLISRTGRS